MRIAGTQPNKFEIFQEFYYVVKGVEISYKKAVEMFYKMDGATHNEFCKYYADKTDYQLIYQTDANGNLLLDNNGNEIIINVPYTKANGYGLDNNFSESAHRNLNQAYIGQKYTIEAYAVKNGLILDPVWSQYSPEEIIQMENEGVNIPQEILDIAHTILEGSGENYEGGEDEEGAGETTTERESFLELIPKAEKHINKLSENREKIDDKIDDLLSENQSNQKSLFSKQKEQLDELKEYEEKIREWRHLQDKINNGEELTDSEARKYAQITGMLQDKNTKSKDFGLDKNKITFSLNEINILAVLGEKLATETIEIGDELADYISQDNYKRTRDDVMGEVGLLRGIVAMANGKALAQEASKIGNESKEYTEETTGTINDIAGVLGVKQMIANPGAADASDTREPVEIKQAENETATEGTVKEQPATKDEEQKVQEEASNEENNTVEEDFIINDENVLGLIKEAGEINIDLLKEIKDALVALKMAKDDKAFAKRANKIIDKMVQQFEQEEQERQQEISQKEQENKDAQERIDELKGGEENKELTEKYNVKTDDGENSEKNSEIEEKQAIIDKNNQDIEALKVESESAKEEFIQKVKAPKETIAQSIPEETKALEKDTKYKDEIIPEDVERLDFTDSSGGTLFKMGKYRITVGLEFLAAGFFCPPLRILGMYHIARGTASSLIGATAKVVSNIPTPKVADKAVNASTENEEQAIEGLNEVDTMISGITGEQTEAEKAEALQSEEEQSGEDNGETPSEEGSAENGDSSAGEEGVPTLSAPAQTNMTSTASGETIVVNSATGAPADPVTGESEEPEEETPAGKVEDDVDDTEDPEDAKNAEEDAKEAEEQGAEPTTSSSKSSKKKEEQMDTDKAGSSVKDIQGSAKDSAKDSEKTKKDTEKDEKQLEKETKRLTKEMKRDEQQIIKMTKESLRAAKKQEEILVRYEELVAENEEIAAEEESKQGAAPAAAQQQQTQQTAQQAGQQGGATAVAGGATVVDSSQGSSSDNQAKMEANNQEISVLGGQFKVCGNKIARNRTKIIKLQKSTKTKHKKFEKKNKIRETKVKEANKKEEEKQKKLAKQLGTVGIAENVFSITLATGLILSAIPWSASVGAVMVKIGTWGGVLCGLTKAVINFANGNSMAGLMALAQTAITIATSGAGASSAAGNVLGKVSAGLSVVASSAELVNNVRAVQGKEANSTMSMISTIAGVASSATSSASNLGNMGGASTFGKAMTIASTVGTALSSASQLMNQFGWGDEKTRNLLGTIGSAISTAASVGQIAENMKNKASDKNKDANEKAEKSKEEKKAEKEQRKADKEAEKQAKKDLKAEKKEEKKAQKAQQKEEKQKAKEAEKAEKAQKKEEKAKAKEDKEDKKANEQSSATVQSSSQSEQTSQATAQQENSAPEQAVKAEKQADANSEKMNEMKADNADNEQVFADNQNSEDKPVDGKKDEVKKSDDKPVEDAPVAENVDASISDLEKSKTEKSQEKAQKASKEEQEKQELELAKKEREQKQQEKDALTEDDLMTTDEKGEKVRATHADGTEVTLSEARANMTMRGASKEFAAMDDDMLKSEITSLDAELKAAPADQNNNGNQDQNNNQNSNTDNQTKVEKQQKLDKLKKEQENRKAYQKRQEKLRKHENKETLNKVEGVVKNGVETITNKLQSSASNDDEEDKKKKRGFLPVIFTAHTQKIRAVHANMVSGTSDPSQDLEELRKKQKRIRSLAS